MKMIMDDKETMGDIDDWVAMKKSNKVLENHRKKMLGTSCRQIIAQQR